MNLFREYDDHIDSDIADDGPAISSSTLIPGIKRLHKSNSVVSPINGASRLSRTISASPAVTGRDRSESINVEPGMFVSVSMSGLPIVMIPQQSSLDVPVPKSSSSTRNSTAISVTSQNQHAPPPPLSHGNALSRSSDSVSSPSTQLNTSPSSSTNGVPMPPPPPPPTPKSTQNSSGGIPPPPPPPPMLRKLSRQDQQQAFGGTVSPLSPQPTMRPQDLQNLDSEQSDEVSLAPTLSPASEDRRSRSLERRGDVSPSLAPKSAPEHRRSRSLDYHRSQSDSPPLSVAVNENLSPDTTPTGRRRSLSPMDAVDPSSSDESTSTSPAAHTRRSVYVPGSRRRSISPNARSGLVPEPSMSLTPSPNLRRRSSLGNTPSQEPKPASTPNPNRMSTTIGADDMPNVTRRRTRIDGDAGPVPLVKSTSIVDLNVSHTSASLLAGLMDSEIKPQRTPELSRESSSSHFSTPKVLSRAPSLNPSPTSSPQTNMRSSSIVGSRVSTNLSSPMASPAQPVRLSPTTSTNSLTRTSSLQFGQGDICRASRRRSAYENSPLSLLHVSSNNLMAIHELHQYVEGEEAPAQTAIQRERNRLSDQTARHSSSRTRI